MNNNTKFQISFISWESNNIYLRYESEDEIVVKTMRLHNTSVDVIKPELSVFRKDKFKGVFNFSIPFKADYAKGVTFVVRDETHKEQYSIAIDFSIKKIDIKEMMYGA